MWTQEAYCLLRSKYSLCCPSPGGYPIPRLEIPHPRWGVPILRYPPILAWLGGTPSLARGIPHYGVPPERKLDQQKYYGMEMGYPPRKGMGPVKVLWDGDGVHPPRKDMGQVEVLGDGRWDTPPPPGMDWQTNWNYYLPSSFGCGW